MPCDREATHRLRYVVGEKVRRRPTCLPHVDNWVKRLLTNAEIGTIAIYWAGVDRGQHGGTKTGSGSAFRASPEFAASVRTGVKREVPQSSVPMPVTIGPDPTCRWRRGPDQTPCGAEATHKIRWHEHEGARQLFSCQRHTAYWVKYLMSTRLPERLTVYVRDTGISGRTSVDDEEAEPAE